MRNQWEVESRGGVTERGEKEKKVGEMFQLYIGVFDSWEVFL